MGSTDDSQVRVMSVEERRPPEQVRRIGRALIELARIQLTAEAATSDPTDGPCPDEEGEPE